MKKIQIIPFVLTLTACATPTPAPTVTATPTPPTPSATATPSFTETPIFTPTPELTAEQQAWKEAVAPAGFEYRADGTMWDVQNNVAVTGIDWKAGTFTETFEGKPLVIPLTPDMVTPLKDEIGNVLPGQVDLGDTAYIWNRKELVKRINPYDGTLLNNRWEDLAFLANPSNVDGKIRDLDLAIMVKPFFIRNVNNLQHPYIKYHGIKIQGTGHGFGDNIVPIADGRGDYIVEDTTVYTVFDTWDTTLPMYVLRYWGSDHKLHERMGYGNVASNSQEANNPAKWSPYYIRNRPKW